MMFRTCFQWFQQGQKTQKQWQAFGPAVKTPISHVGVSEFIPASSFLLVQTLRGSGAGPHNRVLANYVEDLD